MTEGSVTEIVSEACRFAKVFVEHKCAADNARYLSYLKRVGKSCAVMLLDRREKNLSFVHKTAKRFAVSYLVAVALKFGTNVARNVRFVASASVSGKKSKP